MRIFAPPLLLLVLTLAWLVGHTKLALALPQAHLAPLLALLSNGFFFPQPQALMESLTHTHTLSCPFLAHSILTS